MVSPVNVPAVQSRISFLRERFEPWAAAHPLETAGAPVAPPTVADFEPFGTVYQEALEAARARPAQGPTAWYSGGVPAWGSPATLLAGAGSQYGGWLGHTGSGIPVDPTAIPTGASVGRIGGYGRLTPPAELAVFGNGRIPAEALALIGQGGHRLWAPAAQAWSNAVDAAAAEGIELRITDSYRTYDSQVDLARRKGLYAEGGLAATPGTSNHGWGLAVDVIVDDPRALDWLRQNAWQYGFVEAVPREPWHWEFRPHQA